MRVDAAALLTPRRGIVLAGVAAICMSLSNLKAGGARSGGTGTLGPPPREKSNKPTLTLVDERLKQVKLSDTARTPILPVLKASYAIISIFDAISGMGIVKKDMVGNCDKIWGHLLDGGETLQDLCDAEIEAVGGNAERAGRVDGSACNSALWLVRALRLVEGILKELVRDVALTLKEACLNAYAKSLKKHHNMVLKRVFGVAVNAAPDRQTFMAKLTPASEAEALKAISKLLPAFSKMVLAVEGYLKARGIER